MIALASLLAAAQLVVFQQDGTFAANDFEAKSLPRLRALAAARGLTLSVRDARAGVPSDVHTTPLIAYQDEGGRSIFHGRYADIDRIGQFLRTVSGGPLANAETAQQRMAVWRRGRAVVTSPIKITGLSGVIPQRFDENAFTLRARRAVLSGFTRFREEARVLVGPSDRAFYMDFHPHRDASGRLFVSTAIYSGFDCVEPVFSGFDEPVSGPWAEQDEVFARAARTLEDHVAQLSVSSAAGDAFDPVGKDVPVSTWESLGLALPPRPERSPLPAKTVLALPRRLVVLDARPDDPPRLQFRFAAPLDAYSGEVRGLSGTIVLGDGARLKGATGTLDAVTASVTMGNKTLDAELAGSMLRVATFPRATFVLDPVDAADVPLSLSVPIPFTATGHLDMLGVSVPISVNAQAESVLAEDGTPRLDVRARFRLRIGAAFGLKGPDGPSPASDTLEFYVRLMLAPEAGGAGVSPKAAR